VASSVFGHRFEQVALPEIQPEFFDDDDLGAADLPDQEMGNPHLAGGAVLVIAPIRAMHSHENPAPPP
jgi:hypothetical protein